MTNRDAIKLVKRVEAWQKRLGPLGLSHWRIEAVTITDEVPGTSSSCAAVQSSNSYDSCHFWFTNDFVDNASEKELDETIIHEWMHVFLRDFDTAIESVEDQLAPPARDLWEERLVHEREGIVDRLSRQIYALYDKSK